MRGGGGLLLLQQASPTPLPLCSITSFPWLLAKPTRALHLRYSPSPLVVRSTYDQITQEPAAVVERERQKQSPNQQEQDSNGYPILASPRKAISAIRTVFLRAVIAVAVSRFKFQDSQDSSSSSQAREYPLESLAFLHTREYSLESSSSSTNPEESPSESQPQVGECAAPESSLQEDPQQRVPELIEEIGVSLPEIDKGHDVPYVRPGLVSPGFSFSAAGFLFPYHLGVAQCLIEYGYIKENTPLAGSSAGALVSAVIASGMTMDDAMRATKELAADCRDKGTAFRLGVVLRESLNGCLPEDAHIRSNGRIQVAITQVFRSPKALIVSQFDSKTDLIDGLLTSCFIPGYFAPRPVTLYRKRVCVDGGLTQFMPPTSADRTVKVCAFSASRLGLKGVGISPDCNPMRENASPRQLLNWALEPASDEILDDFFEMGYKDALVWVTNASKF